MRQRDSAQEDISESIQIWEGLHRDQPKSDAIRYELASTLVRARNFGMHPITQAFRAHELTAELLRTAPDLPRYQSLRANSLQSLALAELRSGKVPAARRHLDEALETYTKLHQDSPEISAYALKRSAVLEAKADLEIRVGNPEAAAALFEDAVAQLRTAIDTNQSNASLLRIELQRLRRRQDRRGTRDE
jgi:tetratricopeptide (TPR) repeat protein